MELLIAQTFDAYDKANRIKACDLYESIIFRILIEDLNRLDWSSFVFSAVMYLDNSSAAYHFLTGAGEDLAQMFNNCPQVDATSFVNFLNMCEGFYSADAAAMRVLQSASVQRFSEKRRRRFC